MTDPLSAKFAALADPTRRSMLARLSLGDLTLADLAKPLEITVPAVAKHLAVLERAGFVTRSRPTKSVSRPASQIGFLSVRSAISHSAGWNGTFDRLAEFLTDDHVQRTTLIGSF